MPTEVDLAIVDSLDSFSLQDTLGTFAPGAPAFSDSLSITEGVSLIEAGFINLPLEGVSLSDAENLTLGLLVCRKEIGWGAGDQAYPCDQNINDSTPLWIGDNLDTVIVGIVLSVSDTISLSDNLDSDTQAIVLSLTDTITLSDGNIVVTGVVGSFTESLTISDTLGTFAPDSLGFSDTLSLSDSISVNEGTGAITFTMSDILALSDSETIVLGCNELPNDTLALSDLSLALETGILTVADQLVLSDLLQIKAPIQGFEVSDSLLFTEQLTIKYGVLEGSTTDALNLLDQVVFSLIVVDPQVFDSYTLSDSVLVKLDVASLRFSDSLSLSDLIAIQNNFNKTVSVADTLTLSDALATNTFTDFIDYIRRYLNDVPSNSNVGS